jgi:hypothetical protein
VTAVTSADAQTARVADAAMDLVAWFAVLPMCLVSSLTGLVSSLGTAWGMIRHYWVLIKLLATIPATALLFLHMRPISMLAAATGMAQHSGDIAGMRNLLAIAAAVTLLLLLGLTALSIYKPRGMTGYGTRRTANSSD